MQFYVEDERDFGSLPDETSVVGVWKEGGRRLRGLITARLARTIFSGSIPAADVACSIEAAQKELDLPGSGWQKT